MYTSRATANVCVWGHGTVTTLRCVHSRIDLYPKDFTYNKVRRTGTNNKTCIRIFWTRKYGREGVLSNNIHICICICLDEELSISVRSRPLNLLYYVRYTSYTRSFLPFSLWYSLCSFTNTTTRRFARRPDACFK